MCYLSAYNFNWVKVDEEKILVSNHTKEPEENNLVF